MRGKRQYIINQGRDRTSRARNIPSKRRWQGIGLKSDALQYPVDDREHAGGDLHGEIDEENQQHSSIPPSQTTEDQSSTTPASNKKGLAQNDESFDNSRTVETETVARVNRCSTCGENLSQVLVTDYERRTRIDRAAQASCSRNV